MVTIDGPCFSAHARLLTDPPLWCWEIVDAHGTLVASSWQSEWKAYPSAGEALRRALPALVKLSRGRLGPAAARQSQPRPLARAGRAGLPPLAPAVGDSSPLL